MFMYLMFTVMCWVALDEHYARYPDDNITVVHRLFMSFAWPVTFGIILADFIKE